MSDKAILLLVSVVLMTAVVILNLIFSPKNCWDQYTTEQEAISNCEVRQ
jgi:Na+(H+)/acetate symporter ActP